jgi:hypothetical protein
MKLELTLADINCIVSTMLTSASVDIPEWRYTADYREKLGRKLEVLAHDVKVEVAVVEGKLKEPV